MWIESAYREAWRHARKLFAAKNDRDPAQKLAISIAIDELSSQMKADSDLAWTWHSNIAVAFMDEGGSHKQANEAAARFMLTAFGVDVRLSDQWKDMVAMINTDKSS